MTHVIILCGGPGQKLWPLSNATRSKQFLQFLQGPDGKDESMIQRLHRQVKQILCPDTILFATSVSQTDAIRNQLGQDVNVITEPSRRGTYASIVLCSAWLADNGASEEDNVIVVPCDTYSDDNYFRTLAGIGKVLTSGTNIALVGVPPLKPSTEYGYILPSTSKDNKVDFFIEKPTREQALELIAKGGLWNGGVFAFKLGYMSGCIDAKNASRRTETVLAEFDNLARGSFDKQVVEENDSLAYISYAGFWRDLDTWEAFAHVMSHSVTGNVIDDGCHASTIINELNIPLICQGINDAIVAASPDGILVTHKQNSAGIKALVSELNSRPMYEERRWGSYKVVDNVNFEDGYCALTKQLTLNPGCSISYQRHDCRDEVWTFVNGTGEIILDGERRVVQRGDVVEIPHGRLHALRALTPLTFIEVQKGRNLVEEDIERFPYDWGDKD